MNVLGHTYVADRVRPGDAEHALGAVLPDLATMAGVRLAVGAAREVTAATIADGIRCHHATDAAFHTLDRFRVGATALRRDLLDAGLPTGPARAVAHVGYELILDGTLVGTDTEAAYRRALPLAASPAALGAITPAHRSRWVAFVERVGVSGDRPIRYDDVDWVAERLVAILTRRPRLALGAHHVPAVARVLGSHAVSIRAAAPEILASTFGGRVLG